MTPDLLWQIRALLNDYRAMQRDMGNDDSVAAIDECLTALPPDPGGAMPEPMPGMTVTLRNGARCRVEYARLLGSGALWEVVLSNKEGRVWRSAAIREIRTPDGRVVWRAEG